VFGLTFSFLFLWFMAQAHFDTGAGLSPLLSPLDRFHIERQLTFHCLSLDLASVFVQLAIHLGWFTSLRAAASSYFPAIDRALQWRGPRLSVPGTLQAAVLDKNGRIAFQKTAKRRLQ
jgi:hypothetical protein